MVKDWVLEQSCAAVDVQVEMSCVLCHHLLPPPQAHMAIINQTKPGAAGLTVCQQAAREGVESDSVRHPLCCYAG